MAIATRSLGMRSSAAKGRGKVALSSFALFLVAVCLSLYSSRNEWTRTIGTTVGTFFLAPFQRGIDGVSTGVRALWSTYVALIGVEHENETLRARLNALEAQNSRLLELKDENNRLRELLSFTEETGTKGVTGRVIGRDPSNWKQVISVNVGKERGIYHTMPVVSGNGVVGQVIATGYGTTRILLATDSSSGIDAILQDSRVRGVVQGQGSGLSLEYIMGDTEVKVGERVLTSGMDGIYPKGILIGVVTQIIPSKVEGKMFQGITVTPSVDFSRLEEVLFISPPDRQGKE